MWERVFLMGMMAKAKIRNSRVVELWPQDSRGGWRSIPGNYGPAKEHELDSESNRERLDPLRRKATQFNL